LIDDAHAALVSEKRDPGVREAFMAVLVSEIRRSGTP
jgi:hypothetical protein